MTWTQLMKSVPHSAAKCLVSSILILISILSYAQQESKYLVNIGGTKEKAREALVRHIMDYAGEVQVATHQVLEDRNGKKNYKSKTVVDSGVAFNEKDIKYVFLEEGRSGYWMAKILKSDIKIPGVEWKEQNITITEYPKQSVEASGGGKTVDTEKRVTRRTQVVGPSGRVVDSTPDEVTETRIHSNWNGRQGATWEINKEGATGRAILGVGIIAGLLLILLV